MKKLFCIVFILVLSHNYIQGMETETYCARPATFSKDHTLRYGNIEIKRERLSAELYQQLINNCTIFCVDIILVNLETNEYLTIWRKNKPAQNVFYPVGGRMFKGETYFEAAKRLCEGEVNLEVIPLKILTTINHIYPDSAWNNEPSQTPDVVVLAVCKNIETIELDKDHVTYQWCSIFEPHPIKFTEICRRKALKYLRKHNMIEG